MTFDARLLVLLAFMLVALFALVAGVVTGTLLWRDKR